MTTLKPQLLCFGRHQVLLESRTAVLARDYRVVPVSSVDEMRDLPLGIAFDLVLLCHTLRKQDCDEAQIILRDRWPSALVLSMTKVEGSCASVDADSTVRGLDGPRVLLRRLDMLLHPAVAL